MVSPTSSIASGTEVARGCFPCQRKSWYDIGNWDEYVATLRATGEAE